MPLNAFVFAVPRTAMLAALLLGSIAVLGWVLLRRYRANAYRRQGLAQLCEEGATQLFKPLRNNDLILGAVGPLQFDVVELQSYGQVAHRSALEPEITAYRGLVGGATQVQVCL